jgi:hypothetical protein
VEQGQFGQGEEEVMITFRRDHDPVQLGKSGLRARVEGVEEAALEEYVARRPARISRGDGAPSEIAVDDPGINPHRFHWPGARRQGQGERSENGHPPAMDDSPARTYAPRAPPTSKAAIMACP